MTSEQIRDRFTYHPPSDEGRHRHASLTEAFIDVATMVEETCPNGREKNAALKYLENAKFWASAAVARNPETR